MHIDDRNFFSRYLWTERQKNDKEARIEAFKVIKDLTEAEMTKFNIWGLYKPLIEAILNSKAYSIDETHYRNEIVFKEGQFGIFNPLLIEGSGS